MQIFVIIGKSPLKRVGWAAEWAKKNEMLWKAIFMRKNIKKKFFFTNLHILWCLKIIKHDFMTIPDTSKNPLRIPQTIPQNSEGMSNFSRVSK